MGEGDGTGERRKERCERDREKDGGLRGREERQREEEKGR